MRIIGLTGPTGSGKSVVSRALSQMGIYIVDADKIGHDIILKGKEAYKELKPVLKNDNVDVQKGINIVMESLYTKVSGLI